MNCSPKVLAQAAAGFRGLPKNRLRQVYIYLLCHRAQPPSNLTLPVITGTPQAGFTLSGGNGTWSNSPTGYTYRWLANGVAIGGATANTFLVTNAQVGETITFEVTASNADGSSSPATSAATSAVVANGWSFSVVVPAPASGFAISFTGAGTRVVDWGDGSPKSTTNGTVVASHTYASAGTYTMAWWESAGATTAFAFFNQTGSLMLHQILTSPVAATGLTSLFNAFRNCSGLVGSIPSLSNCTGLTNLNNAFAECAGLTGSIPSLSTLTALTNLANAFGDCTGLSGSIPSLSNCTSLTNLSAAFFACSGLTGSIPSLSNCAGLTSLSLAFYGCTGLGGSIPSLSNCTGLIYLDYAFYGCTGLSGSIPSLSNCTALVKLSNAFVSCYNLSGSIPSLSSCTALTDLSSCFANCSGLTGSIPILANCTSLTSLDSAFYGCSGLTANSRTVAQIFGGASYPNLTTANSCFYLANSASSYLLGNAADFISLTKNAGFVVSVNPGSGSYQMFHNQTTLTDYASTPAAWK